MGTFFKVFYLICTGILVILCDQSCLDYEHLMIRAMDFKGWIDLSIHLEFSQMTFTKFTEFIES